MKKGIRYYSYIVVVCFLVNILTTNVGLAFDLQAQQDMLMSDDVLKTVFGDQISTQSDSTNLTDATIATPAKVITTSNGDVYIYSSQGVSAQVSTTKTGETTVTYSMNGANVRIKNEDTGEEFTYQYQIDGAQINLVNSLGVVVETRTVDSFGNTTSLSNQGTIEYVYSDDGLNKIVKSIDQWGNVTVYDSLGRPDYIMYIDSDGSEVMIGDYTFNSKGILESFVDHNGSTTYFESDGIRPAYTTNAQGAITQVYEYDSDNHLISVLEYAGGTDPTKQTIVEDGYYTVMFDLTPVLDEEGNPVLDASGEATFTQTLIGAYNYDEAGHISSVTQIGSGSTVTGWTEYDEWGQVIGQYNQEGVLVTEYVYNERGFLQQTISLGGVDSLTGQQVQLSYTLFDKQSRPAEVWQLGDGSNKVKSQTYEYNGEGFLESTFTYGILRGTDENNTATYNKPVDSAGNLVTDGHFTYITTSQTTFDKKGRPQTVYGIARDSAGNAMLDEEGNVVLEKQQSYVYSKSGFLQKTISYGFGGQVTGETEFDVYSRPTTSTNGQGSTTQLYVYGGDGFLEQTINKGESGVTTGWTDYDVKGKPTEVYNQAGSIVQKYVYDENGLLVMSLNLNGSEGVNSQIVASLSDKELIAAMITDTMQTDVLARVGSLDNQALMTAMWINKDSDPEFAKECCLVVISLFTSGAKGGDQNLINDVGTAYHMLGQLLEAEGNNEGAVAAYKMQASEFTTAVAVAEDGSSQSVTSWSISRLSAMNDGAGVDTAVVTGYTIFGGDSKPLASYSAYEKIDSDPESATYGQNFGVQYAKVQDFVYSYQETVTDADGNEQTVTKYSNFVRKTVNYGDNEEVTGYTTFDKYGRQATTMQCDTMEQVGSDQGSIVQKYGYSTEGFLEFTTSYGKDKAVTGVTVFDNYSRAVASYNNYGKPTNIPDDLMNALADGLTTSDLENTAWQPYLKGLTQTFEYGEDGFMTTSKSWGEATVVDAAKLESFSQAMGSVKGDTNFNSAYDFDGNNAVDAADLAIFESSFEGATGFISALTTYNSAYDFNSDGVVNAKDASLFSKTFTQSAKYMPTYTGETFYDKYTKATEVTNAEGYTVQKYDYNERGFLQTSISYGTMTDAQGNVMTTEEGGDPIMMKTGYTTFNAKSKPISTFSIYNDGTNGVQTAKVQDYNYDADGFLTSTTNYGDNETVSGHTDFDKYGRQTATYNEGDAENPSGYKVSSFIYSDQGFLKQTNNYGLDGAYLGKTVFSKVGRPVESFNMINNGKSDTGLTQTFNYNDYGFLSSSTSYGENKTVTGATTYDGYGKALFAENELGITVSSYQYNERGFLTATKNLAFQIDDSATGEYAVDVTNNNGVTMHGYYVVTGSTTFDALSRPTSSTQNYWETQGEGEGAVVQEFVYTHGFLTSTNNYGIDKTFIGSTNFDKYGRQASTTNEFGETTTKYRYSKQGFLDEAYNYGLNNALVGKTVFNDLGKPTEAYNQRKVVTQVFHYNEMTGAMDESYSYGQDQTLTGTTTYDVFGKAISQTNVEGSLVGDYEYTSQGFMLKANSYGQDPTTGASLKTGYTLYDAASRPVSSWTISEQGVETKVQDFVYNTNITKTMADSQYVGQNNTGFLTLMVNYGDYEDGAQVLTGFTTFNRYGQQDASYNEFNEVTSLYRYSSQGFLSESYNYGVNKAYSGKTVYNALSRPVASYNERNALTQTFVYSNAGFMTESVSLGRINEDGSQAVTGSTYYNGYGKQTHSTNAEGVTVSSYEYNERGFMTKANNLAFSEAAGGTDSVTINGTTVNGWYTVTGYTNYDAATRPVDSYSVFNDGSGECAAQTTVFVYDNKGQATGFITGTNNYTPTLSATGTTATVDNGGVVYNGFTEYNRYGKPSTTYNELGSKISMNQYDGNGFVSATVNYGENGRTLGKLLYDSTGRPDVAVNHKGATTTEYMYNEFGQLEQTISYQNGIQTSYTTFDVYSKAQNTYQMYTATSPNYASDGTYEGNAGGGTQFTSGGTANYTVNSDGTISGGALLQSNKYTSFGAVEQTSSYGRSGTVTSYTKYDDHGRATEVWNTKGEGAKVQDYTYSAQGFLAYTTSYAEMKSFDDEGNPVSDGTWDSSQVTRTYFNELGQQIETYNMTKNSDGTYTQGGRVSLYQYNENGFLSQIRSYSDNTETGLTICDATGRQIIQYNPERNVVARFWYDANGFMYRSTQYAQEE